MTGFPHEPFPQRPFMSCGRDEFAIMDQSRMGSLLTGEAAEPWIRLVVGPGNVVETPPVDVVDHSGLTVRLRCEDAVVVLDFADEAARKRLPDGSEFVYMGGLDEGNDGRGWLPIG